MSRTKKIVAVLFILNMAIFGSYGFLFLDVKKINKNSADLVNEIESLENREDRLRSIKNLITYTKKEREQITGFFVQPAGSIDFIETVESLGRIAGVKIEIGSVGVEAVKSKIGSSTESLRLALKTEGVWSDTIHFLSLLESAPFKLSFETVNLRKISSAPTSINDKKKDPIYWGGDFNFKVLKIKNPPSGALPPN